MTLGKVIVAVVALAISSMSAPVPALAAFKDGNDLWNVCGESDTRNQHLCLQYITGVVDGVTAISARNLPFCPRKGVKAGQIQDLVIRYIESHPQDRDRPAAWLILSALAEAYPCK